MVRVERRRMSALAVLGCVITGLVVIPPVLWVVMLAHVVRESDEPVDEDEYGDQGRP